MESFDFYTKDRITNYINHRKGETKFGEALQFVKNFEELETTKDMTAPTNPNPCTTTISLFLLLFKNSFIFIC